MQRRAWWLRQVPLWLGLLTLSLACGFPLGLGDGTTGGRVKATPEALLENEPPPDVASRHIRLFGYVWQVVDQNYVYLDYNGADWDAVRGAYAPRIQEASDDAVFWRLMREMVAELDDQHSAFLDPNEVLEEDRAVSGALDYVGIGVYVTMAEDADHGVVLLTLPGSPAERSGIRSHERILAIDDVPVCCSPAGADNLDRMQGLPGTEVTLSLQYPGEAPRDVVVVRQHIQGQLPVVSHTVETPGLRAGYLLIPTLWDETVAERVRVALERLLVPTPPGLPVQALIIDLRINGGGAYTELVDLLSLFVDGQVGTFQRRGGIRDPMIVEPDPVGASQELPRAVLVGAETESYAEVFSGVLQELGRAWLVGTPTAGNLETVYPYDLEDGSRLWLAEEVFEPPSGQRWEGKGVQPDVLVSGDWDEFTEGSDRQLDAALALLVEEVTAK
jgi:carboxyl-terminal processing protease